MKIEHIVYVTPEEYEDLIKKSGSKNKRELKEYIKDGLGLTLVDFCVRIRTDDYNICVIDYGWQL